MFLEGRSCQSGGEGQNRPFPGWRSDREIPSVPLFFRCKRGSPFQVSVLTRFELPLGIGRKFNLKIKRVLCDKTFAKKSSNRFHAPRLLPKVPHLTICFTSFLKIPHSLQELFRRLMAEKGTLQGQEAKIENIDPVVRQSPGLQCGKNSADGRPVPAGVVFGNVFLCLSSIDLSMRPSRIADMKKMQVFTFRLVPTPEQETLLSCRHAGFVRNKAFELQKRRLDAGIPVLSLRRYQA